MTSIVIGALRVKSRMKNSDSDTIQKIYNVMLV